MPRGTQDHPSVNLGGVKFVLEKRRRHFILLSLSLNNSISFLHSAMIKKYLKKIPVRGSKVLFCGSGPRLSLHTEGHVHHEETPDPG